LKALLAIFEQQTEYQFIASSLLFVYEGDPNVRSPKVDIRVIDFAHAQINTTPSKDEGFIIGLKSLIRHFTSLSLS